MLFVDAALGKTTKKPVWMMRQAGRALPEYRELRQKFPDFLSFVRNAEAAADATLMPTNRFDIDAAILFSDILVALPYMGFDLKFVPGKGPVISNPFRSESDMQNLHPVNLDNDLEYTKLALQKVRKELSKEKALLGFVGGPITVASYAIEGGSSKDLHCTKALYYQNKSAFESFLSLLAEMTGEYLARQAEWGADALVIMDSWAGHLSREDYVRMAKPFTKKVIKIVRHHTEAPIIHYANGAAHLVDTFTTLDVNVVGVDHRSELSELFNKHPNTIFQGNLDQALLFANPEEIQQQTKKILELSKNRSHVMNLGHGVLPDTPLSGIQAFVDAVRNFD